MDVSIIIVNYNTKELLTNCLHSIYENTKDIEFEIIVSDNGSTDGSIEMIYKQFPNVIVIENGENLGFGKANNNAIKIAKGKYIFFLNSDTVLFNNSVKIFFDYWENNKDKNKIGALGANLLDEENKTTYSYGTFPSYGLSIKQLLTQGIGNFILSIFFIFKIEVPKIFFTKKSLCYFFGNVDYITGADLFILNNDDAKFDESFFLYFEETDLQKRLAKKSKERIIIEGPLIQHLCGGSIKEKPSIRRKASFSRIQFEVSRIKYLKKNNPNFLFLFFCKLLVTINWFNPLLFGKTKYFMKEIWEI